MKLVVASNNPGKLREFGQLLAPLGWETVAQKALGVPECEEPHHTVVENALEKARHAARCTGLPALADDSGLCVPALGGAPGVHSARYAALSDDPALLARGREVVDLANNRKLVAAIDALRGTAGVVDRAWYYCVIVFVRDPLDPCPVIAEGVWTGRIIAEARGTGGFGYDAHFLVDGSGQTAAEMSAERKTAISHRAIALRRLLAALAER